MKIVFFSESQVFGKIPRDFENSRVEYAWMIALDAVHCNIKQVDRLNEKFDLGIVIVPKTNPDVGLAPYREICKNVAVMQEGPHWYFQDYSVDKQFYYYNTLMDADWVYCHNRADLLYFRGLGCKDVRVMRSLMIPERLLPRAAWEDKTMIGGNFVSWYGGFDSYMVAREFGYPIFAPSMGRKQPLEGHIEDITYYPYMNWREWIKKLGRFRIGIHLMRTHAAGTFAMNCAFHGIPSIGYKGLDTQETCHPLTTVRLGDLEGAVLQARKLKNNKDFYKLCSDTAKKRFKNSYTEKAWLDRWEYING